MDPEETRKLAAVALATMAGLDIGAAALIWHRRPRARKIAGVVLAAGLLLEHAALTEA